MGASILVIFPFLLCSGCLCLSQIFASAVEHRAHIHSSSLLARLSEYAAPQALIDRRFGGSVPVEVAPPYDHPSLQSLDRPVNAPSPSRPPFVRHTLKCGWNGRDGGRCPLLSISQERREEERIACGPRCIFIANSSAVPQPLPLPPRPSCPGEISACCCPIWRCLGRPATDMGFRDGSDVELPTD